MTSDSPKRRRVVRRGSRAQTGSTRRRTGATANHGRRNSPPRAAEASRQRQDPATSTGTPPTAVAAPTLNAMADTSITFADLGLPMELAKALKSEGIVHPFPIQAAAIPKALTGRDILGRGPTGSGKTFTFGLPIIAALMQGASKPGAPRGLILVPTRELATQVRSRLEPLAAAAGQRVLEVVGGVKVTHNLRALARPVDILVATPGRAQDLLDQKAITFSDVRAVALDEADQMADMGFLPQVKRLLDAVPRSAQHLLFSATLDGDVKVLVDRYMSSPEEFSTGEAQVRVDSMEHYLVVVPDGPSRNQLVVDIGKRSTRTIMFVRTKHAVDRTAKRMVKAGIKAVALHGDKGQNTRTAAIEAFTSGQASVLVATDIAARGIDISGVDLVVHVDVPAEHKAYVHRAGRTARAGSTGTVVTLTFPDASSDALKLLAKAGVHPTELGGAEFLSTFARPRGR